MEQLRIKPRLPREVMGRMVYAGAEAEGILEDGVTHLLNVKVNGEEIDPERIYSVAVLDMFTLGKLFPYIRDSKENNTLCLSFKGSARLEARAAAVMSYSCPPFHFTRMKVSGTFKSKIKYYVPLTSIHCDM